MKVAISISFALSAVPTAVSQVAECGPGGSFMIAGSSTVRPVAELWAEAYQTACPGISISVEGGGSSAGAGRVCGNNDKGTPAEIGNMSRGWKDSEAVSDNGWMYQCMAGDTSRSAIQVDVAIDGISIVTQAGGAGEACVQALGGLTTDQLRWVFSSYTEDQLAATGWDPASLVNSDGDDSTHLWSELNSACPAVEIKISGPDSESGTYEYFAETVFADMDGGETFDSNRPNGYFNSAEDQDIADYLIANEDAIGYFGFAFYEENKDTIAAARIQNVENDFVAPTSETVGDGTYNPFARRIFMNLLDGDALKNTAPFIAFGYSEEGQALVEETGYVNIPEAEMEEMLSRIGMM